MRLEYLASLSVLGLFVCFFSLQPSIVLAFGDVDTCTMESYVNDECTAVDVGGVSVTVDSNPPEIIVDISNHQNEYDPQSPYGGGSTSSTNEFDDYNKPMTLNECLNTGLEVVSNFSCESHFNSLCSDVSMLGGPDPIYQWMRTPAMARTIVSLIQSVAQGASETFNVTSGRQVISYLIRKTLDGKTTLEIYTNRSLAPMAKFGGRALEAFVRFTSTLSSLASISLLSAEQIHEIVNYGSLNGYQACGPS